MTCKDNCLHYEVCLTAFSSKGMYLGDDAEKMECFKNKADFVEVVRCEKCTRRVDYEGMIMCNKFGHKFQGEWYGLRATTKDHFCSYGKKND